MVALALAWDLGAARWSQAQREAYANDPTLVLGMPAERSFWCSHDQRFVTILIHYRLEVTAADKAVMTRVLAHC